MLDQAIAVQLRRDGFDVVAVQELPDLRGCDDAALLAWATAQSRALVTDNVIDFAPLHQVTVGAGNHHSGIVFCKLPRAKRTLGAWVDRLGNLLQSLPDGALDDDCHWA